jgi:hypothetical protein
LDSSVQEGEPLPGSETRSSRPVSPRNGSAPAQLPRYRNTRQGGRCAICFTSPCPGKDFRGGSETQRTRVRRQALFERRRGVRETGPVAWCTSSGLRPQAPSPNFFGCFDLFERGFHPVRGRDVDLCEGLCPLPALALLDGSLQVFPPLAARSRLLKWRMNSRSASHERRSPSHGARTDLLALAA